MTALSDSPRVLRAPMIRELAVNANRYACDMHSRSVLGIDYGSIYRTQESIVAVAALYDAAPELDTSPAVFAAYDALRREVDEQYDYLMQRCGVFVEVVDEDPYASIHELSADVRDGRLRVLRSEPLGHPYFTAAENDRFRAVHDAFGHAAHGNGFDRHGEEAALVAHSRMFSCLAARALVTETRGQNSWLIAHGDFAVQKCALLGPEAVSDSPYLSGVWE